MRTIPVEKRLQRNHIIVDDCNYERLRHLSLYLSSGTTVRVYWRDPITGKRHTMPLSNIVIQTDAPMVDHRDRNHLNFKVENLRPCNKSQNQMNHGKRRQSTSNPAERYSPYRGVHWIKNAQRWRASVNAGGMHYGLGYFDNDEEAARARDLKAAEVQGEFAVLNFPLP